MKTQIIFAALAMSLCTSTLFAQVDQATIKRNIYSAYDALNRRDFNAFAKLCTDDYTEYSTGPMPIKGIWQAIESYKPFMMAFPDIKFTIEDVVGEGTRYYVKVRLEGTNTGQVFMLPPTGKAIRYTDVDIVEINAQGLCMSHWSANSAAPFQQIGYGALANPNTAVIFDIYDKFGKGDVPGILSICNEEVWFEIQDRSFDNKARLFKGKAEVAAFFKELSEKFKYNKFQPTRFVADGDDVFVVVEAGFNQTATGKKFSANYVHHFRVVNGKIASFKGIDDMPVMW